MYIGFQHKVCVAFCSCETQYVASFSEEPYTGFPSRSILLWLESLVLEGCIGVDAFCRALESKRGKCISSQV